MNLKPGGAHVSKQRETTWIDAEGKNQHGQSFVFKEGDELLFDVGIHPNPLGDDWMPHFEDGLVVEARKPCKGKKGRGGGSYTKGARVVSIQDDGSYMVLQNSHFLVQALSLCAACHVLCTAHSSTKQTKLRTRVRVPPQQGGRPTPSGQMRHR